jgi:hypothetical protein
MGATAYYTLVASLPHLPHFERAEWLPLSRRQLDRRLALLAPEHAAQLARAEHLVQWQRQPITRTGEQVAGEYAEVLARCTHPALRCVQRSTCSPAARKSRLLPLQRGSATTRFSMPLSGCRAHGMKWSTSAGPAMRPSQ